MKKLTIKIISIAMAICLLIGVVPMSIFAEEGDNNVYVDTISEKTENDVKTESASFFESIIKWIVDSAHNLIGKFFAIFNKECPFCGSVHGKAITRGEWIQLLIDECGFPYNVEGELATFADSSDSKYRVAIETAVTYGILDANPEENFSSDAIATREFAAETAVRSMGYVLTDDIVCNDVAEITNPAAAKLAVDLGLLALESGYFYPNRSLSASEADCILSIVESDFTSVGYDDGEHDGFVFLDDVIVKNENFTWETNGDNIILPEGEPVPEIGQILTFGTQKAIKVESVEIINGETTITYSSPELYEFLDYIDVQGTSTLDFANFVPADGVTITTDSEETLNTNAVSNKEPFSGIGKTQPNGFMDDWFDVDEETLGPIETPSLSAEVEITDNIKVVVDLNVKIPSVGYKFDIDFDFKPFNDEPLAEVKNAYVKLSEDISAHVEVVAGSDNTLIDDLVYPPYIELGSIPLVGVDGIGIVLEIDLVLTAEGKFELDYRVHGTLGAQVLNNKLKNISALQTSSSVGLSGAIKVGPKMGLLAEVFGKDLLSFSAEAGVQAKGSIYKRSTGLVCIDAGVTVFAELKALEDCLIDDWLSISAKFTIWDEHNSPLQLRGHWENLVRVPECTYNSKGTIKGTVANADNRTQYIKDAVIDVMDNGSLETETTVRSDINGEYTATVPGGTYLVKISANGYIPFESLETVGESQIIYLETYLLVEGNENSNETGNIGGIISNAVTGSGITNAKLTIRKGWNMTSGTVVDTTNTNNSGYYTLNLPIGNYTICLECDGYVSTHFNVAVSKTDNYNCHSVMNPDGNSSFDLGDMRIILTWTGEPSDLDSHLWGPTIDGEDMYHVSFMDMSYTVDGTTHAYLDRDDTSYEGPETTTVYDMTDNGTYSFYVHDYTNQGDNSSKIMANSGAKVQVYMGEELIAVYNVPTSGVGDTWHVFDFNAVTGTIAGVNIFTTVGDADNVGANQ